MRSPPATAEFDELTAEIASKPAHLFNVRPVSGAYAPSGFSEWNGKGVYRGANPAEGALFTVWVKDFTGDEIKIAITNATGAPVANLKAPGVAGFTRLNWDLRPTEDVLTKYGRPEYAKLLAERPHVLPLNAAAMVAAFKKWDSDVGAQKTK